MPLTLLRHTQPDVAEGICYGRTNLDVADTFADEARRAEQQLPPCDLLISSPARRCRKLAGYISAARNLPLIEDARLLEIDFGRWEQLPWARIPAAELDAWGADLLHANPYEGESVAQLSQRVSALLEHYPFQGRHVVWVTHAGVIKAAGHQMQQRTGGGGLEFDWSLSVKFGRYITFADSYERLEQQPGNNI